MSIDSDDTGQNQSEASSPETVNILVANAHHGICLSPDGEVTDLTRNEAATHLNQKATLVCHASFTARRLGIPIPPRRENLLDILELYAFVRPAQFCLPTPKGLALALNLSTPFSLEEEALVLGQAADLLLAELKDPSYGFSKQSMAIVQAMARGNWSWAPAVLEALRSAETGTPAPSRQSLDIWTYLADWEEYAPHGASDPEPVDESEARMRLEAMLSLSIEGYENENRSEQSAYAAMASQAFSPRDKAGHPNIVLAEAGTGIGKTLGYIAPASVWADKNGPGIWISTYTKNLQRQIDQELSRLYPDPVERARKSVIRKGRENYLCLLNYQENLERRSQVEMGLIARWALYSRDGDMIGGDFPAWLGALFPKRSGSGEVLAGPTLASLGLTDRRGECIYSACPHFKKCFIEKTVRRSRRALIVVANHALVMTQAALEGLSHHQESRDNDKQEERIRPARYIFDEGHHIFDAADSAFSSHLSGQEGAELRRWIRGPEDRRHRGRGLRERMDDLLEHSVEAEEDLRRLVRAASHLPGPGWTTRLSNEQAMETRECSMEEFLQALFTQIEARNDVGKNGHGDYNLECEPWPPIPDLIEAAHRLDSALQDIAGPLCRIARSLHDLLDDESKTLESQTRTRIEAMIRGLERRGLMTIPAWRAMLKALPQGPQEGFVDWFSLERAYGRLFDLGMHRHWIDPTQPFAETVLEPSHGALITSATLQDETPKDVLVVEEATEGEQEDTWQRAEMRTGVSHLPLPAIRASFASPFDYPAHTKVLIVNDVARENPRAVAAAYRELFVASGGGALGLFTAISRLRNVYEHINEELEAASLPLYAQHIDPMDTGTLVDIFRSETNSCLLGTDAVRDGVDVPGRALRLIVFDRVPWPRPDILHKARRDHFGKRIYDDMITRLRLKQAFGRLVRRADDKGVFVMLDSRTPSRLLTGFPEGVEIQRLGLAEAILTIKSFL